MQECQHDKELQEWEEGLVQEKPSTSAVGIKYCTLAELISIHFTFHTFLGLCLLQC